MMVLRSHSRFPLTVALPTLERVSGILSRLSTPPIPQAAKTPANLTKKGSFYYNWECGRYPMEWSSPAEFEAWCQEEELAYSIELIALSTVHRCDRGLWMLKGVYICSCQLSGGWSKYQKKHLEQQHKIESKKTGCQCHIIIKYYPHTSAILGHYVSEHDHEIGLANITYTWMLQVVREKIKYKLLQKIDPREIVHNLNFNLAVDLIRLQVHDIRDSAPNGSCNQFILLHDICQMACAVEEENIRLHIEDGISTKLWVD
jgi:hypothetical protein